MQEHIKKIKKYFFVEFPYVWDWLRPGKYHGQKGQDRWVIREVFRGKRHGFFVDLGASDGVSGSNTYVLENKFNWTGICIESNASFFEMLRRKRKCLCDNSCIDGSEGAVQFFEKGPLGGIVDHDTDNNYAVRVQKLIMGKTNIVIKNTVTLEDVLEKHAAPRVMDYLSLDVEGAEERILKHFPFEKYTFLALTIERPTLLLNRLLFQKGYVFIRKSKVHNNFDSFYVHHTMDKSLSLHKELFSETPRKIR